MTWSASEPKHCPLGSRPTSRESQVEPDTTRFANGPVVSCEKSRKSFQTGATTHQSRKQALTNQPSSWSGVTTHPLRPRASNHKKTPSSNDPTGNSRVYGINPTLLWFSRLIALNFQSAMVTPSDTVVSNSNRIRSNGNHGRTVEHVTIRLAVAFLFRLESDATRSRNTNGGIEPRFFEPKPNETRNRLRAIWYAIGWVAASFSTWRLTNIFPNANKQGFSVADPSSSSQTLCSTSSSKCAISKMAKVSLSMFRLSKFRYAWVR